MNPAVSVSLFGLQPRRVSRVDFLFQEENFSLILYHLESRAFVYVSTIDCFFIMCFLGGEGAQ